MPTMLTTSVLPVATVESTVATIEIKDTVAIVYLNNLCEERRKTKKKTPPPKIKSNQKWKRKEKMQDSTICNTYCGTHPPQNTSCL